MAKLFTLWATLMLPWVNQSSAASFAERLGWKPADIVLILHVDDAGMSHASNLGVFKSLEQGVGTSFAIMMPCSWVPEMAAYIKQNPHVDSGLHLTLTSEWVPYRWGPLAGKPAVPGLVDEQGCLWRNVPQVVQNASADEIEREIRAQIARAEELKIPITHMDSHMGTLFARADYFERYVKVGIEKQIPILAAGGHLTYVKQENAAAVDALQAYVEKIWSGGLPVLDDLHTATYDWKPEEKKERFLKLIEDLKPGLTEILFHASEHTEELPLITGSAKSRKADLEVLMDKDVKAALEKRGIILTNWKELMQRRKAAK